MKYFVFLFILLSSLSINAQKWSLFHENIVNQETGNLEYVLNVPTKEEVTFVYVQKFLKDNCGCVIDRIDWNNCVMYGYFFVDNMNWSTANSSAYRRYDGVAKIDFKIATGDCQIYILGSGVTISYEGSQITKDGKTIIPRTLNIPYKDAYAQIGKEYFFNAYVESINSLFDNLKSFIRNH